MNAAKPISDEQIDLALRNIRSKIGEDCEGYFDANRIGEAIEHSLSSGPELLYELARVSLPILLAADAERIVKNRAGAIYAYVVLQERVGEARLTAHLSRQSHFYMELSQGHLLGNSVRKLRR